MNHSHDRVERRKWEPLHKQHIWFETVLNESERQREWRENEQNRTEKIKMVWSRRQTNFGRVTHTEWMADADGTGSCLTQTRLQTCLMASAADRQSGWQTTVANVETAYLMPASGESNRGRRWTVKGKGWRQKEGPKCVAMRSNLSCLAPFLATANLSVDMNVCPLSYWYSLDWVSTLSLFALTFFVTTMTLVMSPSET